MLYEVITPDDERRRERDDVAGYPDIGTALPGLEVRLEAARADCAVARRELDRGNQTDVADVRITSYNVCYTKLLRVRLFSP